jgi:plasmid replication initiation protein
MDNTPDLLNQLDMFVADIVDVVPKGDLVTMEYPIFAISKHKDANIYRYEHPTSGDWLEVIPSAEGRATIHDKDLLIYAFGQLAEAANRGKPTSRRVKITAYDYFMNTGRRPDGRSYQALGDTLARLRGTVFKTNIHAKNGTSASKRSVFGLIDSGACVTGPDGRLQHVEIVISEELYASISKNQILTYNRAYFELTSGYDRRLYEICRKHCGNQQLWDIGLEKLWTKFGVRSSLREFRRKIKEAVEAQNIPDYFIDYETAKTSGTIEKLIVMRDKEGHLKRDYFNSGATAG